MKIKFQRYAFYTDPALRNSVNGFLNIQPADCAEKLIAYKDANEDDEYDVKKFLKFEHFDFSCGLFIHILKRNGENKFQYICIILYRYSSQFKYGLRCMIHTSFCRACSFVFGLC